MGIPGFFKWLTDKDHYPNIVKFCAEYEPFYDKNGAHQPLDETQPNPNGIEYDNLYLDMTGIVHSSTKSDYCPKPKNEDEIMKSIFDCLDRIFSIVRPRQLLYIAIDGVAPRAKLNQQRSRRFLELQDALDKTDEKEEIKSKILANGNSIPEDQIEHFDENCITPGTSFMLHLTHCLRYYIYNRMNTNAAWRSIKVILSDANIPGEGEHKIMNYIRRQRKQTGYNPNTQHVIFGTDADLIVLSLATHERYVTIMRDELYANKAHFCEICRQLGHDYKECKGIPKEKLGQSNDLLSNPIKTKYIFVDLSILRDELFSSLLRNNRLPFNWDFERFLDDWVFICLLIGNDFLPDSPSFEVYENVIDDLVNIYLQIIPRFNDYLTENGVLEREILEIILIEFGKRENEIFKNRHTVSQQWQNNGQLPKTQVKPSPILDEVKSLREKPMPMRFGPPSTFRRPDSSLNKPVAVKIQSSETQVSNSSVTTPSNSQQNNETKPESSASATTNRLEEHTDPNDPVRLWEEGWHERYYKSKFDADKNRLDTCRMQVVEHYIRGLCWVLQYYYHGVPSWDWCYPRHYAPFASDFFNLKDVAIHFNENSAPSKPLEQLICLLPPQWAKYLPKTWQPLILEKHSPISDFYPKSVSIDPNGKRYKSQYTALLPFIDEEVLHEVLKNNYSSLTSEEKKRNEDGNDLLFIHSKHSLYHYLKEKLDANGGKRITHENALQIPSIIEISGHIWLDVDDDKIIPIGKAVKAPLPNYSTISNNRVMCFKYSN